MQLIRRASSLRGAAVALAASTAFLLFPLAASGQQPDLSESSSGPAVLVDDFTEHTYSVRAGPIGSFADLLVERTFPEAIIGITVTIVSGRADDIGFVGGIQVTDAPPRCSDVGTVLTPVDVTSQVSVDGNTASLLLRAQENCCCVTGWGSATQSDRANARLHWEVMFGGELEVTLDPAPPDDRYVIESAPEMPEIGATAKLVGFTPDPTPTTTFTWTVELSTNENQPPGPVPFDQDIVQDATTVGEDRYVLELVSPGDFRGGSLKIKASAEVDGETVEGETPDGLRIEGRNPQRTAIQSYIDQEVPNNGFVSLAAADLRDTLKRMACREGPGQRQFAASANGGVGPPIVSFDDGVGIFQITNTARCSDPFRVCPNLIFNWQANVEEGIATLRDKAGSARRYPSRLRGGAGGQYRDYIRNTINPQREAAGLRPIPGAPAPRFTNEGRLGSEPPNQLLEDAVRGYNGFNGSLFGIAGLHEFRPNEDFLMTVPDDQLRGLNRNPAVWRRVQPHERPASGDRAYVTNVTALAPECGG